MAQKPNFIAQKIIFDLKAWIILVYDPIILSGQRTHNFIKVIS